MAGISDLLETAFLQWFFKQTVFTPPATTLFFSFHSADPGDTGANELSSGSSPGYARAELDPDPNSATNVNYSAATVVGSAMQVKNLLSITWPTATNTWNSGNPVAFFGIWNALSGGTFFASGTINGGPGVSILAGQTPICIANNFTASID